VEFLEIVCKAANQPFSKTLAGESTGYGLEIEASTLAAWVFAHAGDIFDYDTHQYNFQNDSVVAAMQFLQELILKGCAGVVAEKYSDDRDFGAGKQLFEINSTSAIPYIRDAIESGAQFDWGFLPFHTPGWHQPKIRLVQV